ncbi:MAG TPA: AAA family ATPase, partial [Roseiflexaceae bacterium]|nr:AAA family ATPase [Roseiflexaceae bacterium]
EHRFESVTPWLGSPSFNSYAAFDRILRDQNEFVGREHDMSAIRRLLCDHRIVCLCGPGGTGKTRLAVQAAAESVALYRDGVYWVSCATLANSTAVLNAVADAVGLERTSTTDTFERLADAFATRQLLILLDNIEQVISEFGALAALLDRAPHVSILATSRIAPRFGGAAVRQVGGLPLPERGADPAASDAGQLFLYCARRVDPNFLPTAEDNMAIAEICGLVDGLPLGIELAAAQINELPPHTIAATLRDGWRHSRARHSQHDRHHQSLALVIDSFWRLLSRSEQRVLSRLGLFQDGFLAEAGRLVADASPFFLHALVASGYLRRSGNGRYQLQELLHQDAFQRLQQRPADLQRVAKRHAVYYLRFVQAREEALFRNQTAKDDIRAEYANIRTAWRWCVAHDVAQVVRAARGLVRFSLATGHLRDASAALEDALAALPPVASSDITYIAVRAKLEVQQSIALHGLSRYDDAEFYAEQALAHARQTGDAETIALAHLACADALIMLTRFAAAQTHLEACLQIATTNQYAWIEAMALMARAYTANALRKYDDTLHDLAASLACFQSIGDLRGEAAALAGIGNIAEERGDTSAHSYYVKSLERYRLLGDREGECAIVHNLGVVQVLTGQYAAARDELELARKTFAGFGNLFGVGLAHYNLGRVERDMSDWHLALSYFETALAMFQQLGIR